jgi:hypothetical protein
VGARWGAGLKNTTQKHVQVIDYKASELRAVELLDDICTNLGAVLKSVPLGPINGATPQASKFTKRWIRTKQPMDEDKDSIQ